MEGEETVAGADQGCAAGIADEASTPGDATDQAQLEPAPTDYRRHIWLLIAIVLVVLAAWLAQRIPVSIPQSGGAEEKGEGAEERDPQPAGVARVPFLGVEPAAPLRFRLARDVRFLTPEDRVVTVSIGEAVHAYPVRLLQVHAGVLDVVGGTELLVCWSNLTQLARCFALPGEAGRTSWQASNIVYKGNVAFYDKETRSLWDSFSGKALRGPRAGEALLPIPVVVHPWVQWLETRPEALVLDLESGTEQLRKRGAYGEAGLQAVSDYLADPSAPVPSGREELDWAPLPPKAFVLGLKIGSRARAYPLERLLATGRQALRDQIGDQTVVVRVTSPATAYATGADGELLEASLMLWFGWKLAHPDTDVWSLAGP